MKRMILPTVVVMLFLLCLYGCSSSTTNGPDSSDASSTSSDAGKHDHTDHAEHVHGEDAHQVDDGQSSMDKMKAELAKLSPEDAASAEKQHFCPVSGKMLGTMGPPQKVNVDGRDVWICCGGCEDSLRENPAEYLAKLKQP